MRTIKVMADYFRYPLWDASSRSSGPISPNSLPISGSLRDALSAWGREFDATIEMNDPSQAGFDTQNDVDEFKARGYELGDRLRKDLGPIMM